MISIIISSYQPHFYDALRVNIKATIGAVPYELIQVSNPGIMGICEAYNNGASQAQYDYLCFVHEDILFKSEKWGEHLLAHLQDVTVGAIGIAGSAYKSRVPSTWSIYEPYIAYHIVQHYQALANSEALQRYHPLETDSSYDVVTLDGVFIGTRKAVWEAHKFDDQLLTGYHGYDMDFSLEVSQDYRLQVVFDILLEHFSEGKPNKDWMEAALAVSDKWKQQLPKHCIDSLIPKKKHQLEHQAKSSFKRRLKRFGYAPLVRTYYYIKYLIR